MISIYLNKISKIINRRNSTIAIAARTGCARRYHNDLVEIGMAWYINRLTNRALLDGSVVSFKTLSFPRKQSDSTILESYYCHTNDFSRRRGSFWNHFGPQEKSLVFEMHFGAFHERLPYSVRRRRREREDSTTISGLSRAEKRTSTRRFTSLLCREIASWNRKIVIKSDASQRIDESARHAISSRSGSAPQ